MVAMYTITINFIEQFAEFAVIEKRAQQKGVMKNEGDLR